mmetsp:Transcript_2013/g.3560  ORF Transcript_2013/g.3560 Transcript_2013/m.3560 type:complete len:122 (-) Transcript_2013:388-753(-)
MVGMNENVANELITCTNQSKALNKILKIYMNKQSTGTIDQLKLAGLKDISRGPESSSQAPSKTAFHQSDPEKEEKYLQMLEQEALDVTPGELEEQSKKGGQQWSANSTKRMRNFQRKRLAQ